MFPSQCPMLRPLNSRRRWKPCAACRSRCPCAAAGDPPAAAPGRTHRPRRRRGGRISAPATRSALHHDAAARDVHQQRALLHLAEPPRVDQARPSPASAGSSATGCRIRPAAHPARDTARRAPVPRLPAAGCGCDTGCVQSKPRSRFATPLPIAPRPRMPTVLPETRMDCARPRSSASRRRPRRHAPARCGARWRSSARSSPRRPARRCCRWCARSGCRARGSASMSMLSMPTPHLCNSLMRGPAATHVRRAPAGPTTWRSRHRRRPPSGPPGCGP